MSFNAQKAAQVVAFFANKSGNQKINVLKAIKLVYLSDRESISQTGYPILDDSYMSMPHGPVNSITYSHIQGEHDLNECGWSRFLIDRENHEVALAGDYTEEYFNELSEAELNILGKVWKRFGNMSNWEIRDWTHNPNNIPEWENPNGGAKPIPLSRIMRFLGLQDADEQAAIVNSHSEVSTLLSTLQSNH